MAKIRTLIIDDFPLARQVLANALAAEPEIEVVGTAGDARTGKAKIERLCPDVITLDVDLPQIDGLSFLRALLAVRPIPVVVVSALTQAGSASALRALSLGAVDVMAKPDRALSEVGEEFSMQLIDKVKAAARARLHRPAFRAPKYPTDKPSPHRFEARSSAAEQAQPVILLGASTGGCEALMSILGSFPADAPPVVCVQHIPAVFSAVFAQQLEAHTLLRVSEARSGDLLMRGHAYVAPGGKHLWLRDQHGNRLEINEGPLVNRHRPSIDVTFLSAAERLGRRAVAAILSGMGEDGVAGLKAVRAMGGFTLAQDEATSQVFGMPKEAIARGAAIAVAPLGRIANIVLGEARKRAPRRES